MAATILHCQLGCSCKVSGMAAASWVPGAWQCCVIQASDGYTCWQLMMQSVISNLSTVLACQPSVGLQGVGALRLLPAALAATQVARVQTSPLATIGRAASPGPSTDTCAAPCFGSRGVGQRHAWATCAASPLRGPASWSVQIGDLHRPETRGRAPLLSEKGPALLPLAYV